MEFTKEHTGKWVAVKNNSVVAVAVSFPKLKEKIKNRKDKKNISYNLIPSGSMAGHL